MVKREASFFDFKLYRLRIIVAFGSRLNKNLDAVSNTVACVNKLTNQLTQPAIRTGTDVFQGKQARPVGFVPRTIQLPSSKRTSTTGAPIG